MSAAGEPVERDPRLSGHQKPSNPGNIPGDDAENAAVEEFFTRLKQDMRHPKPGQDSIAAALQAVQRMAMEADTEQTAESSAGLICQACASPNRTGNKFCASCGVPLEVVAETAEVHAPGVGTGPAAGAHHYHHHYHHHYFSSPDGVSQAGNFEPRANAAAGRDGGRIRAPLAGAGLSRAEAGVRKLTQDWALSCNTKQLDDLVELYAADALVLRPNVPAVRGTAAIREFFFAALDSGMGEVEMEIQRVEVFGEIAYEAGRCKSLVPVAVNKRREERGKYLLLANRVSGSEWKILADVWSSDLTLSGGVETPVAPAGTLPKLPRKP